MKNLFFFTVLFLSITALNAQSLPARQSLVNDFEDAFTAKEEKKMAKILKKQAKKSGDNLVFVSVKGFEPAENLEDFSYQLINEWKLGPKGILIVFSKTKRKVRIETGSSIWSRLSNDEAKNILDEIMVPEFKKDKYFEGIVLGLEAVKKELNND